MRVMAETYPRSLSEFERQFASEHACRDYLMQLRWPGGFCCPGCGGGEFWTSRRGLLVCRDCQRQVSVTAGTIFQGSHKPLSQWFRAMWYVTGSKSGASALGLQRILGLGSYRTAWAWLHKLRRAMVRPGRDRLAGRVEVDESYLGARQEGSHGRGAGKALVVIAAQEDGAKVGRVRMARVPNASAKSLQRFVTEAVEPGSVVHTDGWAGYAGLVGKGYRHEVSAQGRLDLVGAEEDLLPRVHHVVSLLKRWLMGTHHGAVSQEHLDYYLDEFTFRFNRRTSQYRGKLFYRLIEQATQVAPAPWDQLAQGIRGRKPDHDQ
jgi:transposase-like protein